jgi:hypothetical protein
MARSTPQRGRVGPSPVTACLPRVCLALAAALVPLSAPGAAEPGLPLERIVLFTSGVGFFQHAGEVDGDASVEMTFKADQINDLLKSLVAADPEGRTAASVRYTSRDPVARTLATFAVNLTDNPSLSELLGQLRGERIEVDAAAPATGTIVGVETREVAVRDGETVRRDFVTILTKEGLRTLPLDTITRIKLVDARLQGELEQALAVLASGNDNERKSVKIDFAGRGRRSVRVGYVQEAPIWKTSYRLVLGDAAERAAESKADLQGYAVVENTSDHDWKDVRMALVSGRPISFIMDLYEPLHLPRPVVQEELWAALRPQVYSQDLAREGLRRDADGAEAERLAEQAGDRSLARKAGEKPGRRAAGMGGMGGGLGGMPPAGAVAAAPAGDMLAREQTAMFTGAARLPGLAEAQSIGNLFRYEIDRPVSLARRQSAMLPIVAEQVEAERVSIYDERVLAKHPLAGVRLKNVTKIDLMHGPVTVYDATGYRGDARIEDLPAGSERLLSYAVDLGLEIVPRTEPRPEQLVSVKIVKGALHTSRRLTRTRRLEIKNSGDAATKLLVEHPLEPGWKLVKPAKAEETTRDRHRFAVNAAPREKTELVIEEELPQEQVVAITNLDDPTILLYERAGASSPKVKGVLAEVIRRRQAIQKLADERGAREREIEAIGQEQARIRENMSRLERTSELYTRYVQKFTEQEGRIETLRKEIAERSAEEQKTRREFDAFLSGLEAT